MKNKLIVCLLIILLANNVVLAQIDPIKYCNPKEEICENNTVMECNEEGSGYKIVEACSVGETCSNKVKNEASCENEEDKSIKIFLGILLPLIILLIYFVWRKVKKNDRKEK